MINEALVRLARGGLVYGLGGVLQRFIGLLLLPLFTRELTPGDYGVVALITVLGVAMTGLFNLGTGNAMGILYFREPASTGRRATIIWTNFALVGSNGVLLYAVLYFAAPLLSTWMFRTVEHDTLIRLGMMGLLFGTLSEPWLAYLRMEQRAAKYVMITIASSLLTVVVSIWLVLVMHRGVQGVILSGVLGQLALLLASSSAVAKGLPKGFDPSLLRPLVRIGFPSIFGLFAFLLIDYADRQLIERILGLDALGVYSIGYSFGMIMAVAVGAFSAAWTPFFMSYVSRPEEGAQIFARVMTWYLLISGALVFMFFLAARPVTSLIVGPAFQQAYLVIGLISAASMFKGCYLIALPGVYYAHKLHLQSLIEWIAALINIALNVSLLPRWGIAGAALAACLSYLVLTLLAHVVARRYLRVRYEWPRLGMAAVTMATFCALAYWASTVDWVNFGTMLAVNGAILLAFAIVAGWLLISRSEREWVRARLQS